MRTFRCDSIPISAVLFWGVACMMVVGCPQSTVSDTTCADGGEDCPSSHSCYPACDSSRFEVCAEGTCKVDRDGDGFVVDDDCDDTDPAARPNGDDLTVDGVDQNCDGLDGIDVDGDGWASSTSGGRDCDDEESLVHPLAGEVCDGVDNDCDGGIDNVADGDGDGFDACTDCDDDDTGIHPGALDTFGDAIDQNCDGMDGIDPDSVDLVTLRNQAAWSPRRFIMNTDPDVLLYYAPVVADPTDMEAVTAEFLGDHFFRANVIESFLGRGVSTLSFNDTLTAGCFHESDHCDRLVNKDPEQGHRTYGALFAAGGVDPIELVTSFLHNTSYLGLEKERIEAFWSIRMNWADASTLEEDSLPEWV